MLSSGPVVGSGLVSSSGLGFLPCLQSGDDPRANLLARCPLYCRSMSVILYLVVGLVLAAVVCYGFIILSHRGLGPHWFVLYSVASWLWLSVSHVDQDTGDGASILCSIPDKLVSRVALVHVLKPVRVPLELFIEGPSKECLLVMVLRRFVPGTIAAIGCSAGGMREVPGILRSLDFADFCRPAGNGLDFRQRERTCCRFLGGT